MIDYIAPHIFIARSALRDARGDAVLLIDGRPLERQLEPALRPGLVEAGYHVVPVRLKE